MPDDHKLVNHYELCGRTLLKLSGTLYPPFKTYRTIVTSATAKDTKSIRNAKLFLNKFLSGEKYVLSEVIEPKK